MTSCSGLIGHVDGEGAILVREQLRVTRVVGGADARDARRILVEQGPHDLAGDHVHFVAVGQRDEDVGVLRARGFERARIRAVADQRADIDAILQVAQQFVVGVDDRDFVGFFARQVSTPRCGRPGRRRG